MCMIRDADGIAPTDLIFSKIDEAGRPGKLINLAAAAGLPLSYCSFGTDVPEHMGWLSPKSILNLFTSKTRSKKGAIHDQKVLAVTGGKGGVGKTFVSAHLAARAAQQGLRTLLLDADLGLANIDVMLGISPRGSIANVLQGEAQMADIIVPVSETLHVLPGGSGISDISNLQSSEQILLLDELESIGDDYDLAIVDTAAGIGNNVLYFVSSAQMALVVITPDPTSLTDAYALIKVLSKQRDMRRFMVLVNQAESVDAQMAFRRLSAVADRYLDVYLDYVGNIPSSPKVPSTIRMQKLLRDDSPFTAHLDQMLDQVLSRPVKERQNSGLQLFWHHSLRTGLEVGSSEA